jgi:hypothetical protein
MNHEIQDRIDAIDWYHEFDFGNGLVAKPKSPEDHPKFWAHIRSRLDSIDFAGKTVLGWVLVLLRRTTRGCAGPVNR